jgi:DNA polymerase I-like protein with 3'-5' exonuclease and polymerase domains
MNRLVIWTTADPLQTQSKLYHPLKRFEGQIEVEIVSDYSQVIEQNPQVVFALGGDSLKVLQELSVVHKNRTVYSLRGHKFLLPNQVPVMVSYSPNILDVDYGFYVDLLTDAGMVARLAATGSLEAKLGEYKYVDDFTSFIERVKAIYSQTKKSVRVALDLETIGLDEFRKKDSTHPGARIVSIQVSCEMGHSHVKYFHSEMEEQTFLLDFESAKQLSYILSSPEIILTGANLKFDLRWLWRRGRFTCTNFKFDTTLVGSMLDENRSNGLDVHTKIYVPDLGGYSDQFDQVVDKSRMDLVLKEQLLPYAGGDTDACYQVAEVMKEELLKDKQLTAFYVNILHPAARAFERLERGGILIDQEKMRRLEADLNDEAIKIVHRAKQIFGGRLVAKHAKEDRAGGMNITKASLITDYMFTKAGLNLDPIDFTEKTKKPSTSMDHIMKFKDVPEAQELVLLLRDYGSLNKTLTSYVIGFLKHLRSDGRFHPSFYFFVGDRNDDDEGGANTGRLSAKNPAVQTIPVHTVWAKRIQECYIAPPGYLIGGRDFSQGELRVIACIANEPSMLEAYRKGMDLHSITSGNIRGFTYEEMMELKKKDKHAFDELRYLGKSMNFGLCLKSNSLILTNYGLIKIEDVKSYHLLWDGKEWVNHDGVIFKGWKEVIEWDGVEATPEHKVWLETGEKVQLQEAKRDKKKLACTAIGNMPIKFNPKVSSRGYVASRNVWKKKSLVSRCDMPMLQYGTQCTSREHSSTFDKGLLSSLFSQKIFRLKSRNAWNKIRCYGAALQSRYTQAVKRLQRKRNQVFIRIKRALYSMGIGEMAGYRFQEIGIRQREQQRPLRTKQFEISNKPRKSSESRTQFETYISRKGNVNDGLAESVCITKDNGLCKRRVNGGANYSEGKRVNSEQKKELERFGYKIRRVRVYDILNAGPRHRFTCNGKLVSNCYGMGAEGFQLYAELNYGVKLTLEQATDYRSQFFKLYSALVDYHAFQKKWARKYKEVRSPLGRVRHLPLIDSSRQDIRAKAERQSINAPTQSCLSDMLLWSFAECEIEMEEAYENGWIQPWSAIHDAGYDYLLEDKAEDLIRQQVDIMQNLPFHKVGWQPQLQFIADAKLGYNMAELKELKL